MSETDHNPEKRGKGRQALRIALGISLMAVGLAGQVAIGLSFESMRPPGIAWRVFGLLNFGAVEIGGFALFYSTIRRSNSE